MKRSLGIGLSVAIVTPIILTAAVSWGASTDTGCWDEYNKRGTRMYRTVTPKGLDLGDCTPAADCKWGYAARDGKRNRLYVPHGQDPATACTDITTTTMPTITTTPPAGPDAPAAPDRFELLPVGAALPSDETCAQQVRSMSENRPENAAANATRGSSANATYPRVTGDFTGTTDEIIQWTACKWGIDEDWVRAQIVNESYWNQGAMGDFTGDATACIPRYPIGNYPAQYNGDREHTGECPESIGLGQVRWLYHQNAFDDSIDSTAYNLDYTYAVWRTCFEGGFGWLNDVDGRGDYAAGDAAGCLGVWFTGRWYTEAAYGYLDRFNDTLSSRTWEQESFPAAQPDGDEPFPPIVTTPPSTTATTTPTTPAPTTPTTPAPTTPTTPTPTTPTTPAPTTPATTAPSTTVAPPPPSGELLPIYTAQPGCAEGDVIPLGQAPAAKNFEPLGSIWCFDLLDPPARTAVEGANSWVDDFTVGCPVAAPAGCTSMMKLDDGMMGYRVFNRTGEAPPEQAQHWINQNHWMVDSRGGFTGGSSIRPDRSFKFENGMFVVEGDFAAAIPEYGDETWGEITITSAPEPTGEIADNLYAYGQFGGHWTVGCRLHSTRINTCAVEGPTENTPPNGNCFAIPGGYRVMELSFFQDCGSVHSGGFPSGAAAEAWRQCVPDGFDMACRDRFRLEVTKDSLTLYVNGVKYFEDANWPAAQQLPDSFLNGDIYVYQSNWQVRAGNRAYRYHWDHFAVNPPNGPTPGEWYR